jgi:hypothetical protein
METKVCSICGKEKIISNDKTISEFSIDKHGKLGFKSYCKQCHNEHEKEYREKNKELILHKQKIERAKEDNSEKRYRDKNRLMILIRACIKRSIKNNLPYDSKNDLYNYLNLIFENKKCECCGRELSSGKRTELRNTASIDRIIPEKGYVVGNVSISCCRCNSIKNDANWEELDNISKWIKNKINIA